MGHTMNHGLESTYRRLREINAKWHVELGPQHSDGWIAGQHFQRADAAPFLGLLLNIQERLNTTHRKATAASFALRFGWSAAAAFGPYLLDKRVPDVRLENISLRFTQSTLFERVALHQPLEWHSRAPGTDALARLRAVLVDQTTPVIEALYQWSKLPRKALWGQIVSSWGAQFGVILGGLDRSDEVLQTARSFFDATGPAFAQRPEFYNVEHCGVTRVYHIRSSCCLYYKIKPESYCASCPLISNAERIARNKAWIERGM